MKKSYFLFATTGLMVYLAFSSNSTGPASVQNAILTGGPRSGGKTCAQTGCHNPPGSGVTNASFIHFVDKATQQPVQSYVAGRTYSLRLTGFNASGRRNWGLQVVAMNDMDSSQGGSFFVSNPDLAVRQVQGVQVVEHQHRIFSPGNLVVDLDWSAPVSASGPITFYGIMNCVDSSLDQNNDNPSLPFSLAIQDHTHIAQWASTARFEVHPLPVRDQAYLYLEQVPIGEYRVLLSNAQGQRLLDHTLTVGDTPWRWPLDMGAYPSGVYFLSIEHSQTKARRTLVVARN